MKFTTGEIISIGIGRLCCPIDGVYRILNFLTGDNLFTHQLPRAMRTSQQWVRDQHPWLAQLEPRGCTPETWCTWLADVEDRFGQEHELTALPDGAWKRMDPVNEAISMVGDPAKVIVVAP